MTGTTGGGTTMGGTMTGGTMATGTTSATGTRTVGATAVGVTIGATPSTARNLRSATAARRLIACSRIGSSPIFPRSAAATTSSGIGTAGSSPTATISDSTAT